ncbi:MAG: calcium-binding protein [Thermoleophilaceae bacterium]|nr:calcium-binding protein [Thermoleophilaceae bacterium]
MPLSRLALIAVSFTLALPAAAVAQGQGSPTLVSLQPAALLADFGGTATQTALRTTARIESGDAGQTVVTQQGESLVVTNSGGPGVQVEPSGPGLAACTGGPTQITCPAAGVTLVRMVGAGADDVLDASAVGIRFSGNGGAGNDRLVAGTTGQNALTGGPGHDTLVGSNSGQDFMTGDIRGDRATRGNDTLLGNGSDDIMEGGPGSDLIDGGASTQDFHSLGFQPGPAVLTLGDGLCNDGTASDTAAAGSPPVTGCSANGVDRDLVRNIERVSGTSAADDITGSPAAENIFGGGGADDIEGGLGADTLLGGGGPDVLTSRDGVVDAAVQCAADPNERTAGERAVADQNDIVDPSCTTIERGTFATPGPVGTPPSSDPSVPAPFQPTPTPAITPGVPSNGAEGKGPGGGDGRTPPELQIISPVATVTRGGTAALRVRCVYKAKDCVGNITITARGAAKAGKGKRRVSIKAGTRLGRQTLTIPWGTSKPTPVRVSKAVRALFKAGADRIKATAVVRARDGAAGTRGAEARVTAKVTLGAAGRR